MIRPRTWPRIFSARSLWVGACSAGRPIQRAVSQLSFDALECYVITDLRKKGRIKRGSEVKTINLDFEDLSNLDAVGSGFTPEQSYLYAWVTDLLDQVIDEVEDYYCNRGMNIHWEVFRLRILKPAFEGCKPIPYKKYVPNMGLPNRLRPPTWRPQSAECFLVS